MSFESVNNPCGCESGLEYPYCCGASDRKELNILAKISNDGDIEGNIPEGLRSAIESVALTPDLYPVKLNLFRDNVQLVKMSPYWYSESVFLDPGRILGTCAVESSAHWLLEKTQDMPSKITPVIFHTAFCGSTLMSNALDAIYECLPIREPEALSNLQVYLRSHVPEPQKAVWFQRVFNLLGRRYEDNQVAVIKANDYANGLIRDAMMRRPDTPVLLMYTPLADFFAGCMKAPNRKVWIKDRYKAIAGIATEKLSGLTTANIDENSIGQIAAVYWSYNMALYTSALEKDAAKIKSLNFNDMLKAPLEAVLACGELFGLEQQSSVKPEDEMKWLLGVYSKDATYEYSPRKRRDDLQKLLIDNAEEMAVAEKTARLLLGDNYPVNGLAKSLV